MTNIRLYDVYLDADNEYTALVWSTDFAATLRERQKQRHAEVERRLESAQAEEKEAEASSDTPLPLHTIEEENDKEENGEHSDSKPAA